MKILSFILCCWLLALFASAKSQDKCKICKEFAESFKKARAFVFILINDHSLTITGVGI